MADRHVFYSVADRSGICFFTPGSGMEKNTDPGSGMNIPDPILRTQYLYQFSGLKILRFFDADPDP